MQIIKSIMYCEYVMGIVSVAFDKDNRIVIVDGLLKDMSGKVVVVNKRNKRVNIELEFMGNAKIV